MTGVNDDTNIRFTMMLLVVLIKKMTPHGFSFADFQDLFELPWQDELNEIRLDGWEPTTLGEIRY